MYCVKCGVELADSQRVCPLCGTRVFHPDIPRTPADPPYPPDERVHPEEVNRSGVCFILTALALLLTACISVPLGIVAALRHNRCCDHLIRCCAFLGNSLPGFFIALLLLYCFALKLNFFTVLGGSGFGGLLLPALALAIPMSAKYIRHIRSNILEEINRDYVAGALVRGIPKATVFRRFILRSLGSTLITLLSLSVGSLLGGTAIIEMIFMIDGIGKMAMDAILMRDYPVVQAYVVWTAFIFTCVNLVTDLLLHQLEPQARQFTKGGGW